MIRCCLCKEELTDFNRSKEHIIPNALGGRRKVEKLLCVRCNSASGAGWDADLANQFAMLSLLVGVKRERGETPSQKVRDSQGAEYWLHPDGTKSALKPLVQDCVSGSRRKFKISARNFQEAKKIAKGIKKKYPNADMTDLQSKIDETIKYSPIPIEMTIQYGGLSQGRSMVKSALATAVEAGVIATSCEHAMSYLTDGNSEPCFGYYYEKDVVQNRELGVPFHAIYVKGDPNNKLLLSYLEYFGCARIICCLSSKYSGPFFEHSYSIDPRTSSPLSLKFSLDLKPHEIKHLYDYKYIPNGAQEEALGHVLAVAMERLERLEFDRAFTRAVQKVVQKYKGIFVSTFGLEVKIMEEMKPFLINSGAWKEGESVFDFVSRLRSSRRL